MSSKAFDLGLTRVKLPGRYVGGEINQVFKNPEEVSLRWALIDPDVDEIGLPQETLPPKGNKVASSSQDRNSCTPSESRA